MAAASTGRSRSWPADPRTFAARAGSVGAIVLLTAFLMRDVLSGARAFYYRDLHLFWINLAEAFVRTVTTGSWPVWNRWVSFGQPLAAVPNAQVFYPITWLNLLLLPTTYYTLFVASHLLIAAAGAYRLSRRLGLSRAAATLSAALWIASGPFLSVVSINNHLAGAAWLSWSAWAADRAFASGRSVDAAVWGGGLAIMVVAGSPETVLMGVAIGFVFAVRHQGRGGSRVLRTLALAGVFAVALSAAQWVPAAELVLHSRRKDFTVAQKAVWSVPVGGLAQAVVPALVDPLLTRPALRQYLWEGRAPFLPSLYLGMAAAGLVVAGAGSRRIAHALAALFVACSIFALGRYGPLYWSLALLPLRYPCKALILAAFVWALLAGFGLDALIAERPRALRTAQLIASALALGVGWVGLLLLLRPETYGPLLVAATPTRSVTLLIEPVWRSLLTTSIVGFGVAALLTTTMRRYLGWAWSPAMLLLVVGELAFVNRPLNGTVPSALLRYRPPALSYILDRPPLSRVYPYEYDLPATFTDRHLGYRGPALRAGADAARGDEVLATRAGLDGKVLGQWGVETAYTLDALGLFPRDLAALHWFLRMQEGTPTHLRLLQMGAVSRMVALHSDGLQDLTLRAELPTQYRETVKIFDVPDPLPRAYAVEGSRIADQIDALRTIQDPSFDPRREVILPSGSPTAPHADFRGQVRVAKMVPDRVILEVEMSRPGFVVLVDTFDPGWRARVDGQPAAILRANVAFRAVAVPAGAHRVEMEYRPFSVSLGLAVTLAGIVGAVLLGRRSTPAPAPPGDRAAGAGPA